MSCHVRTSLSGTRYTPVSKQQRSDVETVVLRFERLSPGPLPRLVLLVRVARKYDTRWDRVCRLGVPPGTPPLDVCIGGQVIVCDHGAVHIVLSTVIR